MNIMSTSSETIEGMTFRLCPRCGLRNYVRADGKVSPEFCKRCDPIPPDVQGLHVQLHGLCKEEGAEPFTWRVRIVDVDGEAIYSTEVESRDSGRQLLAIITKDLLRFIRELGL